LPITDLADRLRAGRLHPVDLLEAYLDRIAAQDDQLGAFVHLNVHARAAAEEAGRKIAEGGWLGPLHGVPIAVKDNYLTLDMPTKAGTIAPGLDAPLRDATAIARLRGAGAVLIGKTRMHEYAWGMETPPTVNPRDLGRVPGGSSGGSGAAVAAGLCAAALGSDTGGSIRIPASLCGCVGLKPTFGLIGRGGIVPHSWSLDHAGPLAASVADAAILTAAMAGPDLEDPGAAYRTAPDWSAAFAGGVSGLRVGVCRRHFFEGLTPDVEAAAENALSKLAAKGAQIVEFDVPELDASLGAIFAIELASSTAYHDKRLRDGHVADFSPDVRALVEMGRFVSGADYLMAERYRRLLGERFVQHFENFDVVVSPTMPLTAWRVGDQRVQVGARDESVLTVSWRLTYLWNLLGFPALTLPVANDRQGLPIGFQIAAPAFAETLVIRTAKALEDEYGLWPRTAPT
jgi:aspartyl-tRNA(Asn)/glutamyl-tRNA(Gln) amidotransferase subunit A